VSRVELSNTLHGQVERYTIIIVTLKFLNFYTIHVLTIYKF